jgi:anthranilate synthase/aminodeoxychorismate synthase-like glutamine amidotransferase
MMLLIDNYDSFVHNLARYFRRLGCEIEVLRNDQTTAEAIAARTDIQAIVLSPGPCTPTEAGCSLDLVKKLSMLKPILGVCLGHQTIAAAFGGNVVRAEEPRHGRSSLITHDSSGIFQGLPSPLRVGRYHSLVVEESNLPADLIITARDEKGVIMAVAHRKHPVFGVQFHPESILTDFGYEMIGNFLDIAGISRRESATLGTSEGPPLVIEKMPATARPVTF